MQAYKCDEQDLIEVPKVYTLCVYTNQQKQNYTVKNIWVTSTMFWSSQLHACCVRDTLQHFKGMFPI